MKSVTDQTLVFTPNEAQVKGDDFPPPSFSKDTCKQLRVEMKYGDVKKNQIYFETATSEETYFKGN